MNWDAYRFKTEEELIATGWKQDAIFSNYFYRMYEDDTITNGMYVLFNKPLVGYTIEDHGIRMDDYFITESMVVPMCPLHYLLIYGRRPNESV